MDPNIQYGGNSLPTSTSTSTPSPDIINLNLNDNSNFPNMFFNFNDNINSINNIRMRYYVSKSFEDDIEFLPIRRKFNAAQAASFSPSAFSPSHWLSFLKKKVFLFLLLLLIMYRIVLIFYF